MGGELFDRFPEQVAIADAELGYSIPDLCLRDPLNRLNQTLFTQPALFVVNALAFLNYLSETGKLPGTAAGHSLGEYNALFAAGVFDFQTGIRLVKHRANLMARASGGGMAAVVGLILALGGAAGVPASLGEMVIALLTQSFELGIRGAAPAMVALLLATVVMGLISRTVPQINVMSIGFGINNLVTLGVLSISLGTICYLFQDQIDGAMGTIMQSLSPSS